MQTIADMVYTTVFDYIAMIENLIDCDSLVDCKNSADYARLVIPKVADKIMISLNANKFVVCVNAIKELAAWRDSFEFY